VQVVLALVQITAVAIQFFLLSLQQVVAEVVLQILMESAVVRAVAVDKHLETILLLQLVELALLVKVMMAELVETMLLEVLLVQAVAAVAQMQ
jgi:hypothetical protein